MLAILSLATPSGASEDPEEKREQVRTEEAEKSAYLDELTAKADAANARLKQAQASRKKAAGRLREAKEAVAEADAQVEVARTEIERLKKDTLPIRAELRRLSVDAFIGRGQVGSADLLDADDPLDATKRDAIRSVVGGDLTTTKEELRVNLIDMQAAEDLATEASQRAAAERKSADAELAKVKKAEDRQNSAVADLEAEVDELALRVDELRQIDASLTDEIDSRNAAFADYLRSMPPPELAAGEVIDVTFEPRVADETPKPSATTVPVATTVPDSGDSGDNGGGSGDGGSDGGSTTTTPTPTTRPTPTTPDPSGYDSPFYVPGYPPPPASWVPPADLPLPSEIVWYGGLGVNRSIAPRLEALLEAASAAGVPLTGGGYRTLEGQLRARRNNCGSSQAAIWTWPSRACSVPTAIPGRSMHQKGLAVDFQYNGKTICFPKRSSSCTNNRGFSWLVANANKYGFYNLPSEAWHWSTNGN